MRKHLAPLACGATTALLLYGLLWAAERRLPEPEDPWLDGWMADGLRVEFRSQSTEPENHFFISEMRGSMKGPDFAGTQIRNYQVQNSSAQVAVLPKAGLLPELEEGRTMNFKIKPDQPACHVCRVGRRILILSIMGKGIPLIGQIKTPKKDVEAVFDAFEEAAGRYP